MRGPALHHPRRPRAARGRRGRARPRPRRAHGRHARDPAHLSGRARDPRAPRLARAARAPRSRCCRAWSRTPAGSPPGSRSIRPPRSARTCSSTTATGVVIGETAEIGDRVTLLSGRDARAAPALPRANATRPSRTTSRSARAPSCSARSRSGHGAKIGANSVVIHDVPPNTTVVGNPGHPVRVDGRQPEGPDTDWLHLPDPVADAMRGLAERIGRARARVAELTGRSTSSRPRSGRCAADKGQNPAGG